MEVVRSQHLSVVVAHALHMAFQGSAARGIATRALNIHSKANAFEWSANLYMSARSGQMMGSPRLKEETRDRSESAEHAAAWKRAHSKKLVTDPAIN